MNENFDAVLIDWTIYTNDAGAFLSGKIYKDGKERFKDGKVVHTSALIQVIDRIALTKSGTSYYLG